MRKNAQDPTALWVDQTIVGRCSLIASIFLAFALCGPQAFAQKSNKKKKKQRAKAQMEAPLESRAFPGEKAKRKKRQSFRTARGFELNLEGYTQVRYQRIEDDPKVAGFIGRNDGFGLSNARLNLTAKKDALSAFFSLEGARDRRLPNNRAEGEVRTMMLDAFMT